MDNVNQVLQKTLTNIGEKWILLAAFMGAFAIIAFIILSKVPIGGKLKSQLAGLCSLIGAYIWYKYFLI